VRSRVHLPPPQCLDAEFAWMRGQGLMGVPMARYTSLRVGGPADLLLIPADLAEVLAIIAWARERDVPLTWMGNGTNLIVRAGGIRGLVVALHDALNHVRPLDPTPLHELRPGDELRLRVGAGVPLTRVLHLVIRQGLMGLAFAVGIPGTMGGAIAMNAGTEAGSTWDVIERVTLLMPDGRMLEVGPHDVAVGYRFASLPPQSVVVEATLRAVKGDAAEVRQEVRRLYGDRRRSQPLSLPNAGSIFKNPPGERAGRLIDQLGLKGYRIGAAAISSQHANFIVNLGQASAHEVLALVDHVKHQTYARTGVLLEEEVRIVGE
jgi:UDP-N-acetylmuramate dehydrogenase